MRFVTGNKILRVLKAKGLAPNLPEDLYSLIKKAVAIRKHLERNRKVCMYAVKLAYIVRESLKSHNSTFCIWLINKRLE